MDYLYFDDFALGQTARTGPAAMPEAEIIAFARQFDPQPMHTDPQAAKSIAGGLIASGWHTASVTMRLLLSTQSKPWAPGTLGLGVEQLKWLRAVHAGDTLHARVEVVGLHASKSRPDRGVVTNHVVTFNQNQQPVLELTTSAMFPKRNAEETSP